MNNPIYQINDTSSIISPGLVLFLDIVKENLQKMIAMSRGVERLRPHCKTHKMEAVVRMLLEQGITRHKAATFAEAEMLADVGVRDIFLAYSLVGPNISRAVEFRKRYPDVEFMVTADHVKPIRELGAAMSAAGQNIQVLLDLDTGQHRTGVEPDDDAAALVYRTIAETEGLIAGGLHMYDGQNHQTDATERQQAATDCYNRAAALRDRLLESGLKVPRIVAGGTGTCGCYAKIDDPTLEASPGTCLLHDIGYGEMFPDLSSTPAALILTRVISRAREDRITVDLGYKAVASDPPAGKRVRFPELPDAEEILQNEEHLVLRTSRATEFEPGDVLLAIPRHICPTSALHKEVTVIEQGEVVDIWQITARDRKLTI